MMYKQIHFRSTDRNIICTAVIVFLTQLKSSYGLNIQDSSFVFAEDFQKPNGSLEAKMMTSYDELTIEKILLNSNDVSSWTAVAMMFSLFVVSPFLHLPLIWFLQDLPLNKQCLLSHLYQDVLKINLLFVWLWAPSGITFKILVENCMIDYLEEFVEFAAITNEALYSLIMIYLCLIGGLRLYIIKFNILDPFADTFGANEGSICKTIRTIVFALVLLIVVIILTTSTKPVAYLQILKSSSDVNELPLSSFLLFLFDVCLCLITTTLHICGKIYQMNQDSKLQKEIIELEISLNRSSGNANTNVLRSLLW